jgi:hypothetical protein
MASSNSPSPLPSPEKPPPKDARAVEWLRRVNSQYATVLQWAGLIGFLVGAALGDPVIMSGFGGLIPLSMVVGKDK